MIDTTSGMKVQKLLQKSAGLVFEGMFARACTARPTWRSSTLLAEVAGLIDAGRCGTP